MLKELKFVAGAVGKKEIVLGLTHFRIENRTIKGFNGTIGLCGPIDMDLDITPKAEQFMKAIQTCEDTIVLHVTPKGKLSIKSGTFKALVDCLPAENFPEITPEGDKVPLNGGLLKAIKKITPFISDDASRPWSRGILFKGQSAYATNNIALIEAWLGFDFPITVNVPKTAINELIRINEEPEYLQVSENRITFHFSGNRWLCSQTYSTEWPDLSSILNKESIQSKFPESLVSCLEDLKPFTDTFDKVLFNANGTISTSENEDEGAQYNIEGITQEASFNRQHLLTALSIAKTIDFTSWPKPCLFVGDGVRGAIIGMRK